VVRNRLRRRMREIVRAHEKSIPPGFDVVVVAFPDAKKLDFEGTKSQLEALLQKAALIKL